MGGAEGENLEQTELSMEPEEGLDLTTPSSRPELKGLDADPTEPPRFPQEHFQVKASHVCH